MGPQSISDLKQRFLRILKNKESTVLAFAGFNIVDYDKEMIDELKANPTINTNSLFEILW
jgi:hypothetical protein